LIGLAYLTGRKCYDKERKGKGKVLQEAVRPAVTGCLELMEARMIEGRHIDHAQLLQLSRVLLLLVEREELLVNLPVVDQLTKKVVPIEELSEAS
jgi:hypothetical protein